MSNKAQEPGVCSSVVACSHANLHMPSSFPASVLKNVLKMEIVHSQISLDLQSERENHKERAKKELGTIDHNPGLAAGIIVKILPAV